MITKFDRYINESLTDKVYHFTYLNRAYYMLNDNKINLSPVFGTKADLDINSGKLYAFSVTSSRGSDIGYAASLPKMGLTRITLDGRKLNHNYKSKRVDYWKRPKDPKDPMYNPTGTEGGKSLYKYISRQDELEDRVISDKESIPNANKYITSIDILYHDKKDGFNDSREQNNQYIGLIKGLCDKLNIQFNLYHEQEDFDANRTSKSIDVEPINIEIEDKGGRAWDFNEISALMIIKDDKIKDKIFKYIDENMDNSEEIKPDIEKKASTLEYDMKYYADWQVEERGRVIDSYIHNNKSSRNKDIRFIINQFGLDMKKNKCSTIDEYVDYKKWKGKKKEEDFKKEITENINKEIDKLYTQHRDDYLDYGYYDNNGDRYDSFKDDKKLNDFMNNKLDELKDYYKDVTYNNTGSNFEYTFGYSQYNVKDGFGLKDTSEYDNFVRDNYEHIEGHELVNIIYYIINDLDDFLINEVDRIKKEQYEQWNS